MLECKTIRNIVVYIIWLDEIDIMALYDVDEAIYHTRPLFDFYCNCINRSRTQIYHSFQKDASIGLYAFNRLACTLMMTVDENMFTTIISTQYLFVHKPKYNNADKGIFDVLY